MTLNEKTEELFPTEECPHGKCIVDWLKKYEPQNLVYPNDSPDRKAGYIFRGELSCYTPFQSTLEREFFKDDSKLPSRLKRTSISAGNLKEAERFFYDNFAKNGGESVAKITAKSFADFVGEETKRFRDGQASLPSNSRPDNAIGKMEAFLKSESTKLLAPPVSDVFAWLSYMRHYGHPTRLVDFTRDIDIAMYFCKEQFEGHRNADCAYIYCFPCQDLRCPLDEVTNKHPFDPKSFTTIRINMNDALGCEMGLDWAKDYAERYGQDQRRQSWGWDRPYFENPRLWHQKGMFVYPFDYPAADLTRDGPSWIIQNLLREDKTEPNDRFNMRDVKGSFPAKRLRILREKLPEIEQHLSQQCGTATKAAVYVDFEKVKVAE